MKEIKILDTLPLIFTKDQNFIKNISEQKNIREQNHVHPNSGKIILLPEDAVLVLLPLIKYNEKKSKK